MHESIAAASEGGEPAPAHEPGARHARGRPRPRSRLLALALAGVALGGLAVAVGSAAWTDQVWFAAAASTGTADLVGSIDGGATWHESASSGALELELPAIADLRPGQVHAFTLSIRNTGTLTASLTGAVTSSGALFAGADPVTAVLSGLPASVAGGATVTATLTVTAPTWTGAAHQGEGGSATVRVTGTV